MGIEAVSPSAAVQAAGSAQSLDSSQVSDLMRLEQDIRKMKNEFRSQAEKKGLSQNAINMKIKEYDKLIAQIEQQIQQARQNAARKSAQPQHRQKSGSRRQQADGPTVFVAELKASYRALPSPSSLLSDMSCALETEAFSPSAASAPASAPAPAAAAPAEPVVSQEPAVSVEAENIQLDTLA